MSDLGEARQKVVADWLFLSAAMRGCADSINRYITLVAATHTHPETVQSLLQLPSLPAPADFMSNAYAVPSASGSAKAGSNKRSPSVDDEALEEGGKKKRKKQKKEKDPNAPKRPGSAYIFFQNEIRPEMKDQHPTVSYRDLVGLMAQRWGALTDAEKEPYQRAANDAMRAWRIEDAKYRGADPPVQNGSPLQPQGDFDESNIFKQDGMAVGEDDESLGHF